MTIARRALSGALLAGGVALSTLLVPGTALATDKDDYEPAYEYVEYDFDVYADIKKYEKKYKKVRKYDKDEHEYYYKKVYDGYKARYDIKDHDYKGKIVVDCDYKAKHRKYECESTSYLHEKYGDKKKGSVYATYSYYEGKYDYKGYVKDGEGDYEDADGTYRAKAKKDYDLKVYYDYRVKEYKDDDDEDY